MIDKCLAGRCSDAKFIISFFRALLPNFKSGAMSTSPLIIELKVANGMEVCVAGRGYLEELDFQYPGSDG